MEIILGKIVKIKEMNNKNNLTIMNYLHQNGIIKGKKNIHNHYYVPIIEFQDCTRIWILPKELEFI